MPLDAYGFPKVSAVATLTQKTGSLSGVNYTTTSATFVDVDAANLAYTVTVPVGWKLSVVATATVGNTTSLAGVAIQIFDTQGSVSLGQARGDVPTTNGLEQITATGLVVGDGLSHTVKLRWATTSSTGILVNPASETVVFSPVPHMNFLLMPSN